MSSSCSTAQQLSYTDGNRALFLSRPCNKAKRGKEKKMTITEKFAAWLDSVNLTSASENTDDIVVLYDDIKNGFSECTADFQVIKKNDKFVIQPSDKEIVSFEYPAESKTDLISHLDSLYPEHGGVHGEETFLHNMKRNN